MPYTKQHLKADLAPNPEAFLTEPSIPEERLHPRLLTHRQPVQTASLRSAVCRCCLCMNCYKKADSPKAAC